MTREEMIARKAELERKLAARANKPEYAGNRKALQAEIDKLERMLNQDSGDAD